MAFHHSDLSDFFPLDFDNVPLSDINRFLQRTTQMSFTVTDLIASDATFGATVVDPNLINPWGVSFSATGPFWISENNSGVSSIDSVTASGVKINVIPEVTIATPPGQTPGTASPTGQVFNSFSATNAFMLSDGSPAAFIFATEDGTISAWNAKAGTQSILTVDNSANPAAGDEVAGTGAVYKGLAIAQTANGPELFAANFRHGTVDVFDQNFNLVASFTDPTVPKGFAPFNVQVLNGKLFVAFAKQDATKHDDTAGAGNGFVDEFNLNGSLVGRIASRGPLDSPWGLAIAPSTFGNLAGDLLVGNFGSGTIDAYNLTTDQFDGVLKGTDGKPIVIGDLWALTPGNGGSAGSTGTIYFTAGVENEAKGLFGSLTVQTA
jgi:uncharacterized protein (TIGR03118 family)